MRLANKAFTLIELLIVVAIIAILAAIAVPNFLEAQVRSKVSRCKADIRTIATAVEAYAVDNNKYPDASFAAITSSFNNRLLNVTTPIAYLSSLPIDSFRVKRTKFPDSGAPDTSTFDYTDRKTAYEPTGSPLYGFRIWPQEYTFNLYFENENTSWYILSPGPDYNNSPMDTPITLLFTTRRLPHDTYDPTNGTVSYGAIWRTDHVTGK
ncbi:MAG: type II secretion system protein GspG [Candidatus Sumerlaeaceae bacterium]|nr:type II secretion system protein GspG [Candidatus Sumerlaeaceae bacterium]